MLTTTVPLTGPTMQRDDTGQAMEEGRCVRMKGSVGAAVPQPAWMAAHWLGPFTGQPFEAL